MKVICIGSANTEKLISSGSLRAMTRGAYARRELAKILKRFSGGKFDLASYECLQRKNDVVCRFVFLRRTRGKTSLYLIGPRSIYSLPGGSALAIAIGLKRLGANDVALATALAEEEEESSCFAHIQAAAKRHHVRMLPSFGNQCDAATFIIYGVPRKHGRSIVLPHKPPYAVRPKETLQAIRAASGVTHAIATGIRRADEVPFIAAAFQAARKNNPSVITYFMPNVALLRRTPTQLRKSLKEVLQHTSIWQMNASEAGIYLPQRNPTIQGRVESLARLGGVPTTIVTRGARGASAFINGTYYEVSPATGLVVDDAGAGDAFAVGFLAALDLGCTPDECLQLAAWVAGKNIAHVGGWAGNPSQAAFAAELQRLRSQPHA